MLSFRRQPPTTTRITPARRHLGHQNYCAQQIAAIQVTANPTVIQCGGSSLITATARDKAGQVIDGVDFAFALADGSQGLLLPPPTAEETQNSAVLTFGPGQNTSGSARVIAHVGVAGGTNEEEGTGYVNVQQDCQGVSSDGSTAPGGISLTSSEQNLVCGQTAFIGARVVDSKGLTPTSAGVNFLATAGDIPASATTADGEGVLNVVYTAPLIQMDSDVRITAAAGDAFGALTLHVTCNPSGLQGTAGGATGCLTTNGTVCITPPNTGDGGLKDGQ